jgi:hypothetical protein
MKHLRNIPIIPLAALVSFAAAAQGDPPPRESAEIPYSSLDEAMKVLHSKVGVTFRNEAGWIVAYDSKEIVSWLLTPKGHPAYPSIVKRHIVNSADGANMTTEIRCFADKAICDKYFGGK